MNRAIVLCLVGVVMMAGQAFAAPKGKPLSMHEVRKLYAGKTWFWRDGGGYFARSGRFHGKSGYGNSSSQMKGGWWAYAGGKLCFSGTWRTKGGPGFASSCFAHKRIGRTIYQKRLPEGRWYVFKHARIRKNDEYRKLARGKYVNWYSKWRKSQRMTYRKKPRS